METWYIWPQFLAGLLTAGVAIYARRFEPTPAVKPFRWLMVMATYWAWIYSLQIMVDSFALKVRLSQLQHLGVMWMPVLILYLVLEYLGIQNWLKFPRLGLLMLPQLLFFSLAISSDYHTLWRYNYTLNETTMVAVVLYDQGWGTRLYTITNNIQIIGSLSLLLYSFQYRTIYLRELGLMTLGIMLPFVINTLFVLGFTPITGYNLTPMSLCFTGLLYLWAFQQAYLFDVSPIARHLVWDALADMIIILNHQHRVVDFNHAAQVRCQVAVGLHVTHLPVDWGDMWQKEVETTLTRTEVTIPTATTINTYELTSLRIMDDHQRYRGQALLFHDMTEHKAQEAALNQAKKAAEAANQAKSRFLANMSHELRTPLNLVLGFANLLSHSPNMSPTEHEQLQIIQREGDYLLRLINQVLDLSKIEAGRMEVNLTPLQLNPFLADMKAVFGGQIAAKGLTFHVETSPNLPVCIYTDEVKLRQIIINLLNNALKFTRHGGIVMRVDTHPAPQPTHTCLQLEIEDSGVGISLAEQTDLFQDFHQTESGQATSEGTGLGLAITQQLVQLLGGTISVESQPDVGTRFRVELWVEVGATIKTELSTPPPLKQTAPPPQNTTILIVDDKAENRLLLRHMLEPFGFQLHEARHGQEAIELWQTYHPDLIYLDLQMPVLDGFETAAYIRAHEHEKHTVIIAMSASVLTHEQALARQKGCDVILQKPFQEAEFWFFLQQYVNISWPSAPNLDITKEQDAPLYPLLPTAEIATLQEWVTLGKIDQIQQYALHLKTVDEGYLPLAEQLWALAEAIDEAGLQRLMQSFTTKN